VVWYFCKNSIKIATNLTTRKNMPHTISLVLGYNIIEKPGLKINDFSFYFITG
jgi:hypothetical protein